MDNQLPSLINLLGQKKKIWGNLRLKGEVIRKKMEGSPGENPELSLEDDFTDFSRESEIVLGQLQEMDKIILPLYHLWLKEKDSSADRYNKEVEETIAAFVLLNKELLGINEQIVAFIQKEKKNIGERLFSLQKGKGALAGYKTAQSQIPRLSYQG